MTFNKCTIKGKTYGDIGDDFTKAQAGLEEVSKFSKKELTKKGKYFTVQPVTKVF